MPYGASARRVRQRVLGSLRESADYRAPAWVFAGFGAVALEFELQVTLREDGVPQLVARLHEALAPLPAELGRPRRAATGAPV